MSKRSVSPMRQRPQSIPRSQSLCELVLDKDARPKNSHIRKSSPGKTEITLLHMIKAMYPHERLAAIALLVETFPKLKQYSEGYVFKISPRIKSLMDGNF